MPYRLDRCLIDWVSKIKQMKNNKGLLLIALEIWSSAHQTGSKGAGVAALILEQAGSPVDDCPRSLLQFR